MRACELIDEAAALLRDSENIEWGWRGEERQHASDLLEYILGDEPDDDDEVPAAARRRLRAAVQRRAAGEPLAYITGTTEFRGLKLRVGPGAFVPRATSEFLAEMAVRRVRRRRRPVHVDLATGIGPVACAVAHAVRTCEVHGADVSAEAVRQARRNAKVLGLKNAFFHAGDLFGALPDRLRGHVDAITIHPPYVPKREVKLLPVEIRSFEPEHTLTDQSSDGMGLIRRTVREAPDWLRPGGWLLMETHPSDVRAVKSLMKWAGFSEARSHRGEMKWTRVVAAQT